MATEGLRRVRGMTRSVRVRGTEEESMSKHVLDHKTDRGNGEKPERFSKIEADKMPRPQTQKLQKRARKTSESKRLKEFTDIERHSDS
jgi:hypothetical protein